MAGNDQVAELTRERKAFWDGFMRFTLWNGVAIAVLVILLALFVA